MLRLFVVERASATPDVNRDVQVCRRCRAPFEPSGRDVRARALRYVEKLPPLRQLLDLRVSATEVREEADAGFLGVHDQRSRGGARPAAGLHGDHRPEVVFREPRERLLAFHDAKSSTDVKERRFAHQS